MVPVANDVGLSEKGWVDSRVYLLDKAGSSEYGACGREGERGVGGNVQGVWHCLKPNVHQCF